MKRTLMLILVLGMCLSFCACGAGSNNKAIVGEWKAVVMDGAIVFNEDGTGYWSNNGKTFTWKYDKELACYVIADGANLSTQIQTEEGIEYITLYAYKLMLYRPENYDKAIELTIKKRESEVAEWIDGKTKLEIGVTYDFGNDVSVTFSRIAMDGNGNWILEATVVNNGLNQVSIHDVLPSQHSAKYYSYGAPNGTNSNGMMSWNGTRDIPKNTTATITSVIMESTPESEKAVEIFGKVVGAYCFEMNGTQYYINLSEYITK